MSAVLPLDEKASTNEVSDLTQDRILDAIPWKMLAWIMLGIIAVYSLSRVYLHQFAYTVGLDYFEPVWIILAEYYFIFELVQIFRIRITYFEC